MRRLRARAPTLALAALAVAFAWPLQGGGGVSNAHYALVKAFVAGTPGIDEVLPELGDFATADYVVRNGRRYSNKAPGLALAATPAYVALRAAGLRTEGDPARMLWALGLFVVVLPGLVLLALVRAGAERVAAGFGTAAAVALGAATILLPYASVFLSHVLTAALVFAAFTLLWRERGRPPRPLRLAAAGVLAGYAVATEYPAAIAAVILLAYAAASPRPLRRAAAFSAGGAVGAFPLAIYNQWAFGTVLHNSYSGIGDDQSAAEQFGAPSARVAVELLFSANGLLILAPVLACAAYGIVLLYRWGFSAEAAVVAAIAAAYLAFNAAYFSPFGGIWPGARYLIVVLPFLGVALAPAIRTWPATCGALMVVSALVATSITTTRTLAAADGRWLDRLGDGDVTPTIPSLVGITGWYGIIPVALAVAIALAAAAAATPLGEVSRREVVAAGAAVLAWAVLAAAAPRAGEAQTWAGYWPLGLFAAVGAGTLVIRRAYAVRMAQRPVAGDAS